MAGESLSLPGQADLYLGQDTDQFLIAYASKVVGGNTVPYTGNATVTLISGGGPGGSCSDPDATPVTLNFSQITFDAGGVGRIGLNCHNGTDDYRHPYKTPISQPPEEDLSLPMTVFNGANPAIVRVELVDANGQPYPNTPYKECFVHVKPTYLSMPYLASNPFSMSRGTTLDVVIRACIDSMGSLGRVPDCVLLKTNVGNSANGRVSFGFYGTNKTDGNGEAILRITVDSATPAGMYYGRVLVHRIYGAACCDMDAGYTHWVNLAINVPY